MRGKGTLLKRYNGATWDTVSSIYSINGGGRVHEEIEDDDLLDPEAGTDVYRQKDPGSKVLNDITIELRWDPDPTATNDDNQHLLEEDYEASAASYYKVIYTDNGGTGEIWLAWVKELGDSEKLPNETVRRTITLTPTGEFYQTQLDADSWSPT